GVVAVLGLAGLIRGAVPQTVGGPALGGAATDPIVVSGALVREPGSPDVAAEVFTGNIPTGHSHTLTLVATGAGWDTAVMADAGVTMSALATGLRIPAHSSVTLKPGKYHVMIEHLVGPLKPGQFVNLQLTFANAGPVNVSAPVIAINAPAPTVGASR